MSQRLATTSLSEYFILSPGGQPVLRFYSQIKALLIDLVGPKAAGIVAEPVINDVSQEIDWYAPAGAASKYIDLPVEKKNLIDNKIAQLHKSISSTAEKLKGQDQAAVRSATFILQALKIPNLPSIYVVNDEPILINWGMLPTGAEADPEVLRRIADASQARKEALEQRHNQHNQNVDSNIASGNSLANDLTPLLSKIILTFILLVMLVLIADMLLKNCAIGLPRFISGDQALILLDLCESTTNRLESFQDMTDDIYENQATQ